MCFVCTEYQLGFIKFKLSLNCRILHPVQIMLGLICVTASFAGFVYSSENQYQLRKFKRHHPAASLFLVFLVGYIFVYFIGSVMIFMFGLACPVLGEINALLSSLW